MVAPRRDPWNARRNLYADGNGNYGSGSSAMSHSVTSNTSSST